jgi:hypothetical protein
MKTKSGIYQLFNFRYMEEVMIILSPTLQSVLCDIKHSSLKEVLKVLLPTNGSPSKSYLETVCGNYKTMH